MRPVKDHSVMHSLKVSKAAGLLKMKKFRLVDQKRFFLVKSPPKVNYIDLERRIQFRIHHEDRWDLEGMATKVLLS